MIPGTFVTIDFPGAVWHGKAVEVIEDIPQFNLAPEDAPEPFYAHCVRVRGPGGLGLFHIAHIGGTAEAVRRRRWDAEEAGQNDDRQGELLL